MSVNGCTLDDGNADKDDRDILIDEFVPYGEIPQETVDYHPSKSKLKALA